MGKIARNRVTVETSPFHSLTIGEVSQPLWIRPGVPREDCRQVDDLLQGKKVDRKESTKSPAAQGH